MLVPGIADGSIGVDMALTPVLAIAVLLGWRIVRQRPGNPIGWIFVLFSLLAGVTMSSPTATRRTG